MTRIAVISDVHGYSLALQRVLSDISEQGPFDHLVIAGDLVEGGPDPDGSLRQIRALDATVLQGNTDRDLANGFRDSKFSNWVQNQLSDEDLAWLRDLPFSTRIQAPGHTNDESFDVLVVHANPLNMDRAIQPDADASELAKRIDDTKAAVIAFGHIHIAYIRHLDNMTLLDVSAVGNPKDHDLRSKWGSIEWNEELQSWDCQLHYVDYPVDETVALMQSCGMPNAKKHISTFLRAGYE